MDAVQDDEISQGWPFARRASIRFFICKLTFFGMLGMLPEDATRLLSKLALLDATAMCGFQWNKTRELQARGNTTKPKMLARGQDVAGMLLVVWQEAHLQ